MTLCSDGSNSRALPLLAAVVVSSLGMSVSAEAAECSHGATYKVSGSERTIVAMRLATGTSSFQAGGSGPRQAGIALEFVTDTGDRGYIYGPMRSYMFATDASVLRKLGYRWSKVRSDPQGFFRVLTDDGQRELFTFVSKGCAP